MTPFPEAEIMTIKRLEVALRKMDFKLLKDGAYKLHEKYHGGHKFEYFDLLKDIYIEISNNPSVPDDVKNILSPTIEDILSQGGVQTDTSTSPSESLTKEAVIEPAFETQESIQENENKEEGKISAFDAFSPQRPQVQQAPPRYFTQSPFSAEPFRGFNVPKDEPQAISYEEHNIQEQKYDVQEEHYQEIVKETIKEFANFQEDSIQEANNEPQIQQEEKFAQQEAEVNKEKKTVGIFYAQDNSIEKIRNIIKLREIIANSREKEALIDDLFALISEVSTQANGNVIELQGVLGNLADKAKLINLITNSQSAMFMQLLDSINATYDFYKNEDGNKINVIPLFGLSNLFTCEECGEKYFDKSQNIKPLVLECPKCKNAMFPEVYASIEKETINIEYYNEAFVNLANSNVWMLIHPSFNDKISIGLIENVLKVSKVEEIYILDKDINVRESYRKLISKINSEVKIYIQGNVLEDFFNNI